MNLQSYFSPCVFDSLGISSFTYVVPSISTLPILQNIQLNPWSKKKIKITNLWARDISTRMVTISGDALEGNQPFLFWLECRHGGAPS